MPMGTDRLMQPYRDGQAHTITRLKSQLRKRIQSSQKYAADCITFLKTIKKLTPKAHEDIDKFVMSTLGDLATYSKELDAINTGDVVEDVRAEPAKDPYENIGESSGDKYSFVNTEKLKPSKLGENPLL